VPPVLGAARRLVERGHEVRVLTEPCLRRAVEAHGEEGNVGLLLVSDVDRAGHLLRDGLDACGQPAQLVQVGAEDLHRDVGARARQHVVDAVRDGLAD